MEVPLAFFRCSLLLLSLYLLPFSSAVGGEEASELGFLTHGTSSNSSLISKNRAVQLLDSGNLVAREENEEKFLWQSFDYTPATLLPVMKIGSNGIFTSGPIDQFGAYEIWEDWSSGCDREIPLEYSKMICQKNCDCPAYANLNDIGETLSSLRSDDLHDIQEHELGGNYGPVMFERASTSQYVQSVDEGAVQYTVPRRKKKKQVIIHNKKKQVIIVTSVITGIVATALALIVYLHKTKRPSRQDAEGDVSTTNQKKDLELPLFDLATIATATGNFSTENKLGEGGFGPVYKGILRDGQEIAVKKLSRNSKQGKNEFKNEICVAKLQHRNIVKLLGCCVQEEKMLLYEYMPNKSLDFFIFDQMQRQKLNWQKRFDIINGIGRGLLYLHQDSRLRIIHRDLKASNVLLDLDMNPKISDFGLARSFGGNETVSNTKRIVGT